MLPAIEEGGVLRWTMRDETPVRVEPGFWLIAAVYAFVFLPLVNALSFLLWLALALVLFASILLHELAHKRAARLEGAGCERIEIGAYGGLAWIDDLSGEARSRMLIAGPLTNAALGLALLGLWWAWIAVFGDDRGPFYRRSVMRPYQIADLLRAAWILNFGFAAVNMMPCYPLDGAGIVEEWLARRRSRRKARRIVAASGIVLAVGGTILFLLSIPTVAFGGAIVFLPFNGPANVEVWDENAPPI